MAAAGSTEQRAGATLPVRVLQAVVAYWFAIKVAALFFGEPHADEAYYWIWGQHLALSYLDHPPFHAWLQGLVSLALGWNLFALRFLSVVTSAACLWVFWIWAKRLRPDDPRPTFWLTAALFYSAPMLMLYTTVALHDRVLVLLALLSIHCFALFFATWTEGARRYGLLYGGAMLLGLATLTKYTGVLVGVAILLTILSRRDLRLLLRSPHVYLAALLSVAMQAPVIYWNLTEGFISAQFHLARGFEGPAAGFEHVGRIVLETALLIGPFAILPIWRFLSTRAGGGFPGMLHSSAKWVFAATVVAVTLLAFFREALFYWNILAFAAVFAAGAWAFRSRLEQALHIGWGLVVMTVLFVQLALVPFLDSPDADRLYGESEVAAAVQAAEMAQNADFAAAGDWLQASQLAFALKDKDVASISARVDGYDFWFDDEAHRGKTAIVVIDRSEQRAYVRSRFESFEKLGEVPVERFGIPLLTYEIYVGRGYRPETR
ncbi:MAG TPA: glycosyltransferase family 39 protein [Devosia sp.]|nr:glycosyltransferase family 39 protein [Devosia sp.]